MPSGFWLDFKKDFLKEKKDNHSAYGGHLAVYWKSELPRTFNLKEVAEFASKNGWQLVDSLEFQSDRVKTWNYNGISFFPLDYTGFSSSSAYKTVYKNFPRWISTDLKIYKFKTGWLTIEPGTENSIEVNGFVILNNVGSEMCVYHLWGE